MGNNLVVIQCDDLPAQVQVIQEVSRGVRRFYIRRGTLETFLEALPLLLAATQAPSAVA